MTERDGGGGGRLQNKRRAGGVKFYPDKRGSAEKV